MHHTARGASPLRWLAANLTWQGAEVPSLTGGGDDHRRRSPQAAIALAASVCDSRPGGPVVDRVGPAGVANC
jgi:hypothetical protein